MTELLLLLLCRQEPHGAAALSGLLPAHQQQRPGQHVPHHGPGVQGPPGRRRLPLHDLRLAGDVWSLTVDHWPSLHTLLYPSFMFLLASPAAVNRKQAACVYIVIFVVCVSTCFCKRILK